MASVWKARQISLDRTVAIKVLSAKFATDSEDVKRFQSEAQSSAKLKHPGIVQVYDANVKDGMYYFVMEYVSGYTVGDWVRRKSMLKEKDALLVIECVADALDYAWEKEKIIHCDIKPDNVIIDEDGTVKLADLGLARTLSAMGSAKGSEEVMGTPAYMSPEQVQGKADLDCRTDIYSLGAMLYHLVTGKMLFQGSSDDEVMTKQVNDTAKDPIDINPQLSKGICWLIERMMAKDPLEREDDWKSVREDILRVRSGLLPRGKILPENASTIERSTKRTSADYTRNLRFQKAALSVSHPMTRLGMLIVALLFFLMMAALWNEGCRNHKTSSETTSNKTDKPLEPEEPDALNETEPKPEPETEQTEYEEIPETPGNIEARKAYEYIKEWSIAHPDRYTEAIEQFDSVANETAGTRYSLMARNDIRRLEESRENAITEVLAELEEESRQFADIGQYVEAAEIYESYEGRMSVETEEIRKHRALRMRNRADRVEEERQKEKHAVDNRIQERVNGVIQNIYANDLHGAMVLLNEMMGDPSFSEHAVTMKEVSKVLTKTVGINQKILNSFRKQIGRTLNVQLKSGIKTVLIESVDDEMVECKYSLGTGKMSPVTIQFSITDLSSRERLSRMGSDSLPEVALAKGLMALESKAYFLAKKYFAKTHPFLAERLLEELGNNH